MSPLLTRPNLGYPDWQRITDWDGGAILNDQGFVVTGTISSSVFPVGRFGYLAGLISAALGTGWVQFNWYADSAATIVVGERIFVFDSQIANPAQLRIPNMGPYLVVTFGRIAGVNWTCNLTVFLTNRYHPCELIPFAGRVLSQQQLIGAGLTLNYFPTDYYAGPARVMGSFDVGHYTISLYSIDSGDNAILHDQSQNQTITPFTYDVVCPPGYWFLQAFNTAGAGGLLTLTVTDSMTGST